MKKNIKNDKQLLFEMMVKINSDLKLNKRGILSKKILNESHPFGWDYPAGAEHDPNAPWNEKDEPKLNEEFDNDDPLEGKSGTLLLKDGNALNIVFSNFKGTYNDLYLVSFGSNEPFKNFTVKLSQHEFNQLLNGEEVNTEYGILSIEKY